MTTYTMRTKTNVILRSDHNNISNAIGGVASNVTLSGTELFTAPAQLSSNGNVYQFAGDVWLKVTRDGITGWVAYIHKGTQICDSFKATDTPTTYPEAISVNVEVTAQGKIKVNITDPNNLPVDSFVVNGKVYA